MTGIDVAIAFANSRSFAAAADIQLDVADVAGEAATVAVAVGWEVG
jgi:hypothetical protein